MAEDIPPSACQMVYQNACTWPNSVFTHGWLQTNKMQPLSFEIQTKIARIFSGLDKNIPKVYIYQKGSLLYLKVSLGLSLFQLKELDEAKLVT